MLENNVICLRLDGKLKTASRWQKFVIESLNHSNDSFKTAESFSSPSLQNKDPGGGVGSTSRGWRLVGLGVGMGGFRDQGVETGRFRSL